MCGINGIFAYGGRAPPPDRAGLLAARDHMAARGPDGFGEWWAEDRRLGLGHRRLAILDLSERAAQPMISACGRYVVAFNGEIYNYPALRRSLEASGRTLQTTSDTEALLHLYALYGPEMATRLRGMFAFALWDTAARTLFLARDPYGIKPLYLADDGATLRFASQVKALIAGGGCDLTPDAAGLVGFHLWGSVPEPYTLYRGIRALPAGHALFVNENGAGAPFAYASVTAALAVGADRPCPQGEAATLTREALRDSVAAHLLADVEVGVFLSAGVDSGALLGLMRDAGQTKIQAITLAFEEFRDGRQDEAPLAAETAAAYGAEHIVRLVTRQEFEGSIDQIMAAMDQPSVDGVNTWLVSKAAREAGLKVALSGVGGDEALAGYSTFTNVPRLAALTRLPTALPGLSGLARWFGKAAGLKGKAAKICGLLGYGGSEEGAYLLRRSVLLPFELENALDADLVRAGLAELQVEEALRACLTPRPRHPLSRVAALESCFYLRPQLLRDTDWAGMAHGVEIRTPLVDFSFLQTVSAALPWFSAGSGKRAMAAAPSTPLPAAVLARRKTGFAVPTTRWLSQGGADFSAGQASRAWARQVLGRTSPKPAEQV